MEVIDVWSYQVDVLRVRLMNVYYNWLITIGCYYLLSLYCSIAYTIALATPTPGCYGTPLSGSLPHGITDWGRWSWPNLENYRFAPPSSSIAKLSKRQLIKHPAPPETACVHRHVCALGVPSQFLA